MKYQDKMNRLKLQQAKREERQRFKESKREEIVLQGADRELITLAGEDCSRCFGYGQLRVAFGVYKLCQCVLRQAFRRCLHKYLECDILRPRLKVHVVFDVVSCSFPSVEYRGDFWNVCHKACMSVEQRILLREHLLNHSPYTDVIPLIGKAIGDPDFSRGEFFHAVYKTEARMGRAMLDAGLYPFQNYFATKTGNLRIRPAKLASTRWMDPWLGGGNYQDAKPFLPVDVDTPKPWKDKGTVVRRMNNKGRMVSAELPEDIKEALKETK